MGRADPKVELRLAGWSELQIPGTAVGSSCKFPAQAGPSLWFPALCWFEFGVPGRRRRLKSVQGNGLSGYAAGAVGRSLSKSLWSLFFILRKGAYGGKNGVWFLFSVSTLTEDKSRTCLRLLDSLSLCHTYMYICIYIYGHVIFNL